MPPAGFILTTPPEKGGIQIGRHGQNHEYSALTEVAAKKLLEQLAKCKGGADLTVTSIGEVPYVTDTVPGIEGLT